nr:granulocyte-macrophage colony-stimulating factor receptor subunit alpha-like isoform X1 [Pelodiscus sinensis]XP_025033622.1 granulocyte-macrophage colony-stimulating factor receptor subunit alpha-like isoform X1 [Pelodiscus sinensis]XP_025033623.1 granulocyte-macrophage colony-stimulating factor receptor subunit alpha-like isoform X1 [Pelodiscus sinensis]XP_025033624.1 granulocyte-macrophage colony-stimulating factor receptor subunit alpha-like isoform X1 [Pelodiscus sinensis]|eukprot:XP_025033621.1 granulocyte-macrophage colony-stimulating factor receptor subunit alpha-like isoform X1 [Pelodiscus sinensis]
MVATFQFLSMIWSILFFPIWCDDSVNTKMMPSSSPIDNLTFSHTKLQLTWDSSITDIDYNCYMETSQDYIEKEVSEKTCIFSKPIHKGAILGVKGTYNGTEYSEEIRFIPPGKNGTRVENFSCVIYNISFMNCTWDAGRKAPDDTQYFLSLQYSREERVVNCPHYIKDAFGRHIACSFQNVTIIYDPVYFLVKGDSNESEIQFYDESIKLYEIEKLTPPVNITVNCSEDQPRCIVQWKRPQLSWSEGDIDPCFQYQIDIRNKKTNATSEENKNELHMAQGTSFIFENYNVKKKYSLQIRAKGNACLVSKKWGEWSEPIDFGMDGSTTNKI